MQYINTKICAFVCAVYIAHSYHAMDFSVSSMIFRFPMAFSSLDSFQPQQLGSFKRDDGVGTPTLCKPRWHNK